MSKNTKLTNEDVKRIRNEICKFSRYAISNSKRL